MKILIKTAFEIDLIEQNLYNLYKAFASINSLKSGKIAENLNWVLPKNEPYPNFIFGDADEKNIPEIVNAIEQDILPKYWICKNLPDDLSNEKLIEFYGFKKLLNWQAMLLSLKGHRKLKEKSIDFYEVKSNDITKTIELINNNNFGKANVSKDFFAKLLDFNDVFSFYVLKEKKQIVSTCLTFRKNETAGLYMFSTKKEKRNKGFGTTLLQNVIDEQKQFGIKYITLQANNLSVNVFEKLKFKTIGSFDIYGFIGN